jgi:hypothetical protein
MSKFVLRFLKDNSGATAIEYGLIAAGISPRQSAIARCAKTDSRRADHHRRHRFVVDRGRGRELSG